MSGAIVMNRYIYTLLNVLIALTLFLQFGCGLSVKQRAAAQTFSAATIDLATLAEAEFTKSRADVIEMNTFRVKLGDDAVSLDKIDDYFTVDEVKQRVAAANSLKRFGELLHTLVSSSQKEQLKIASDNFVTSLKTVRGVNLSDDQAGAIGSAVQIVGGLWIEYRRAQATREAIAASFPFLMKLSQFIERDFDSKETHWFLGYQVSENALTNQADVVQSDDQVRKDELASLALISEGRVIAKRNQTRFKAVSTSITKAAKQSRAALEELRKSLDCEEVPTQDIQTFWANVKEAAIIFKALRN